MFQHFKIGLRAKPRPWQRRCLYGILVCLSTGIGALQAQNSTANNENARTPGELIQTSEMVKPSDKNTVRFLMQSTMGFTRSDIEKTQSAGFAEWIKIQQKLPLTPTEPYIEFLSSFGNRDQSVPARELPYHKVLSDGNTVGYLNFSTAWIRSILGGRDLLRQRMAWALSQILVVSNKTNLLTEASANYYDLLLSNAFGSYEDLLLQVTLHPVMGRYLSYLGNQKADPKKNRVPDENFAREIMQLFSIGLWQLEENGNRKLDAHNNYIPTYTNKDIQELARVFTGFWLADSWLFGKIDWTKFDQPMSVYAGQHDNSAKTLLDGHIKIPANTNPMEEVKYVVKKLAQHPNTAPFITRKLIQNMVTSNPSADYIDRVVTVWKASNGNLGQVVTAILLDKEARESRPGASKTQKLKEPIIRITNVMKIFSCGSHLGKGPADYPGMQWWHPYLESEIQQEPLGAQSVFNFFDSDYSAPGTIAAKNLVSPEFQLLDAVNLARFTNYLWDGLNAGFHVHPFGLESDPFDCNFHHETQLLESYGPEKLINYLSLMLTAETLSTERKLKIQRIMSKLQSSDEKVRAAILGVAVSSEGAILQ